MTTVTSAAHPNMNRDRIKKHSWLKRALIGIALLLLAAVLVARLYLGVWLLAYVNNVLAHIDGYRGSVESIDINLYRGAYNINNLKLDKLNGHIPVPFIAIQNVDFSIQWRALLHGRIVSSVTMTHPVVNFAVNKGAVQTGENVDWTKPIKDLAPIDINYVDLRDGSITYQDFSSTPRVDIYIHHLNGEIRNLRNVEGPETALPSTVDFNGTSIGNGKLQLAGRMNILRKVPDMDLKLALENVDLPAINSYSEAYAAFDFKSGSFSLYSQFTAKNSQVSGYVKPMVNDLSVDILKNANPVEVVWSALIAGTLKIFSNLPRDQFATRIDLTGDVSNVDVDVWSALGGIFRNAFISAMKKGFEQTGNDDAGKPEK